MTKRIIFVLLLSLCPVLYLAIASFSEEYEVKAAFIYNFSKFIDWPEEASPKEGEAFVIGLLGENPFGDHLKNLKNHKVNGRRIEIQEYTLIEDARHCHILFISNSERKNIQKILGKLTGKHILTVSDIAGFTDQGGMIDFIIAKDKIAFVINRGAMEKEGLEPNSQLLKLAKKIF
jgi:hypothetical protein